MTMTWPPMVTQTSATPVLMHLMCMLVNPKQLINHLTLLRMITMTMLPLLRMITLAIMGTCCWRP